MMSVGRINNREQDVDIEEMHDQMPSSSMIW